MITKCSIMAIKWCILCLACLQLATSDDSYVNKKDKINTFNSSEGNIRDNPLFSVDLKCHSSTSWYNKRYERRFERHARSQPSIQLVPDQLPVEDGKTDEIISKIVGDNVDLPCPATYNYIQENSVVWKYNKTFLDIRQLGQRYVTGGRSLFIENLEVQDSGTYVCEMCGNSSCHDHSVYLIVKDATYDRKNETMQRTFSVSKDAVVFPNSSMTDETQTRRIVLDKTDSHNRTLGSDIDISFDNKDDTGSVEESLPFFKKNDKMTPTVVKLAGSTAQLICPFEGNPLPNITWTRNGTKIKRHSGNVIYKKFFIQMADVITADSGFYKCTVCNRLGCIEHTTKLVIIDRLRSPPIHSDRFPLNQTVLTNSSAMFECRVVSDLEPSVFWVRYLHGGNASVRELEETVPRINAIKDVNQQTGKFGLKLLRSNPDKPENLRLDNVTHKDEGWYTCIAANTLGQSLASAYLRVVDKLPTSEVYSLLRSNPIWNIVAMVLVSLVCFGAIFLVYVLRKLKHEKLMKHRIETVHQWTKRVIIYKAPSYDGSSCDLQIPVIKIEKKRTTITAPANNGDSSQVFNEYEFPLDVNWEIPRNHLNLGSTLGEGAFGRVVMAEAYGLGASTRVLNSRTGQDPIIVAVKMVKDEHTDADMASLVHEMEVMKLIGKHINIINLLACCSQNGPLWVVVEFAPHGNLKDFLKLNRPMFNACSLSLQRNSGTYFVPGEYKPELTEKMLISFAFQIARGMEYLASRKCIHRDLAARNVLVSDDYVMKIADFGLARDIQDTDYYRKNSNGRLPIKWMAPESLQDKFYDSKSDVWSYGVLLWEIMTYGEQPYPHIMCAEELYTYLISGQRMEKPPRCSLNIYMLMRQCWHFNASVRPSFVEIVENLDNILELTQNMLQEEYLDLSIPMLETPPSSSDEDEDKRSNRQYIYSSERKSLRDSADSSRAAIRYQYTYKLN